MGIRKSWAIIAVCVGTVFGSSASAQTPLDQRDFGQLERECNAGDAKSCNQIFVRYSFGRGVEKSPQKAAEYKERACKADDGYACTLYVRHSNQRVEGYPSPNPAILSEYSLKGCDLGDMTGCIMAKQYAQMGYYTEERRVKLLGAGYKAATTSSAPPASAAPKPAAPAPTPKVASTGNRFLDECNAGSAAYCNNYAITLRQGNDYQGAIEYGQKACQMGSQTGCDNARNWASYLDRKANQLTGSSSLADLKKGCEAGNAYGCSRYAYNVGEAGNWKEAIGYAEKGCQLGDSAACSNIRVFKSNYASFGDEKERAESRTWQVKNARETGFYAGAISHLLKKDRDTATLGILISEGGAKGMQALYFEEVEDLALNYPDKSGTAWAVIQNEWQRRGGPQELARRAADQRAWEEEQRRQANSYVPGGRGTRDNSYSSGGYVGSGSSGSSYKPPEQVCTESWREGYGGGRVVTCR